MIVAARAPGGKAEEHGARRGHPVGHSLHAILFEIDAQRVAETLAAVAQACGDAVDAELDALRHDLEEVIRIGRELGYVEDEWADRKRRNVTADLGSHPNISMWVTKQTMIAATTMMWMAEAFGYDTGPMEGFDEEKVRAVLGIPEQVRVLFLLAIGSRQGADGKYPGRLPSSRTVFAERYGQPFELPSLDELHAKRA